MSHILTCILSYLMRGTFISSSDVKPFEDPIHLSAYISKMRHITLESLFSPLFSQNADVKMMNPRMKVLQHIDQPNQQSQMSRSNSLTNTPSIRKHNKRSRKYNKSNYNLSLSPSDSDEETTVQPHRHRKSAVKLSFNSREFDYFSRTKGSDDDNHNQNKNFDNSKISLDEKSKDFKLSITELIECIYSIIMQFTLNEFDQKVLVSSALVSQEIIQFSLDMLVRLESELHLQSTKEILEPHIVKMIHYIFKLLLAANRKFSKSSNTLHVIHDIKLIPKLCSVLSDLVTYFKKNEDDSGKNSNNANDYLLLEFSQGLLLLLQSICNLRGDYQELKLSLSILKSFLNSGGFDTVYQSFKLLSYSMNKTEMLISALSTIVLYLKVWREDIYHTERCDKRTHRHCDYIYIHCHHSEVFGQSDNIAINKSLSNTCLISTFVKLILDCFTYCQNADICIFILKQLTQCGICCCMTTETILSNLLNNLTNRDPRLLTHITTFIEASIWQDLNAIGVKDSMGCFLCHDVTRTESNNKLISGEYSLEESFSSTLSSRGMTAYRNIYRMAGPENIDLELIINESRWSGLKKYQMYVFNDDIGVYIINHLCKIASMSSNCVKQEIAEQVLIPILNVILKSNFDSYSKKFEHFYDIMNGILKCTLMIFSNTKDINLIKILWQDGDVLIKRCLEDTAMRYEALFLTCGLIDVEQQSRMDAQTICPEFESLNLDSLKYSKILEADMNRNGHYWLNYFQNRTEYIRKQYVIHSHYKGDADGIKNVSNELDLTSEVSSTSDLTSSSCCIDLKQDCNTAVESENNHYSKSENEINLDEKGISNTDVNKSDLINNKTFEYCEIPYEELLSKYLSLSQLCDVIAKCAVQSETFASYLKVSPMYDIFSPLLIDILNDMSRSSIQMLKNIGKSIIQKQLKITFILIHSLLTATILVFPKNSEKLSNLLDELRPPLMRYSPNTCSDVKQLVSVLLQCCVLSYSISTPQSGNLSSIKGLYVSEEDLGSSAIDSPMVDTEGYDGDTEQFLYHRSSCGSNKSSDAAKELECPDLVMLALDLIINHHEKFIQSDKDELSTNSPTSDISENHNEKMKNFKDMKTKNKDLDGKTNEDPTLNGDGFDEVDRGVPKIQDEYSNFDNKKSLSSIEEIKKTNKSLASSRQSSISSSYHSAASTDDESDEKKSQSLDVNDKIIDSNSKMNQADVGDKNEIKNENNNELSQEPNFSSPKSINKSIYENQCCESVVNHSLSLTQCVHTLLILCKSSEIVCRQLHQLGFLTRLLEGFTPLINLNDETYQGKLFAFIVLNCRKITI